MALSVAYDRPSRPNRQTIEYLRGLPLNVESAKDEVARFLTSLSERNQQVPDDIDRNENDGQYFPHILAAAFSALREVNAEVASLAGDEHGSQSLEALAQIAVPYSETSARILLHSCSGYCLHLATHRFGSHVLQTILELAATPLSTTDLALHDEAPSLASGEGARESSLPSLFDLILSVVDELSPHSSELAVHFCASHVLRTLLCVLGGVQMEARNVGSPSSVLASRRGWTKPTKKKKRKKNASDDSSSSIAPHPWTMTIVYNTASSRVDPVDFRPTLEAWTYALLGNGSDNEPVASEELACHESAGPVLIVLLRVLTYSSDSARKQWLEGEKVTQNDKNNAPSIAGFRLGVAKNDPRYTKGSLADKVVRQILCWQDNATEQKLASNVIHRLSADERGSHLVETILRLCPDEFHQAVMECGDFLNPSKLQGYVEHRVSNFVIQNLLLSVRSKEQAETLLKIMGRVISSGLAIDPAKRRRGILWRSVEIAAKYHVEQESLLKAIRLGFGAINAFSVNPPEVTTATTEPDAEGVKKTKQRKKASNVQLKHCIPLLIGLKRNQTDGHTISLDAAGTRSVCHMLKFSPRLCQDTLHGLINEMSTEDLVSIAKDGLGSICLMDGILDGPVNTPIFAEATKMLLSKLSGHWATLAGDRVGQHAVKKLFKALPKVDDKAKLVDELAQAGNRLNGTAMGRSVIAACGVDGYLENRKQWRQRTVKLLTSEDSLLADVFPVKGKTSGSADDQDEQVAKSKRKRRRKKENALSPEIGDQPVSSA
jgi:nucleolar protein 9